MNDREIATVAWGHLKNELYATGPQMILQAVEALRRSVWGSDVPVEDMVRLLNDRVMPPDVNLNVRGD